MQDSNRITLPGFIMVNFKINSPQNQFKTNPEATVSKKNLYLFQIFNSIPCAVTL